MEDWNTNISTLDIAGHYAARVRKVVISHILGNPTLVYEDYFTCCISENHVQMIPRELLVSFLTALKVNSLACFQS